MNVSSRFWKGDIELRLSKTEYYLRIALAVSKRSTCLKRHYGAVIVNDDEIIATGYNGNPRGLKNCCELLYCSRMDKPHNSGDYSDCHSVHAEQNAMLSASRREMIGATLYLAAEEIEQSEYCGSAIYGGTTKEIHRDIEPCPICKRMILNSGIKEVVVRDGFDVNGKPQYNILDITQLSKGEV